MDGGIDFRYVGRQIETLMPECCMYEWTDQQTQKT